MNQQDWEGPDASRRPLGIEAVPHDAGRWQAPGAPYGRPGAGAPPLAPQLQHLLLQLLHACESNFPIPEVIHSLHADLLRDAAIRDLPAMRRFTDARFAELHSEVATCGYIRRILSGDRSPTTLPGLQDQLAAMNDAHTAALAAWRELSAAAEVRANPTARALSQVLPLDTQAHRQITALAAPLLRMAPPPQTQR